MPELKHVFPDGCAPLSIEGRRDTTVMLRWIVTVRLAQKTGDTETLCQHCLADAVVTLASVVLDEA